MQMPRRDEFPERPRRPYIPELDYFIFRRRPLRLIRVPLLCWASWWQKEDARFLHNTVLANGLVRVSTICLGLDASYGFGEPLIFESAVIYNGAIDVKGRWSTFEEAEGEHNKLVAEVLLEYGGFLK